jgi:hypothetical protein
VNFLLHNELNPLNKFLIVLSSSAVAKIEAARSFTSKELLAPKVAMFSSRGPTIHYDNIIKVP